jgi:prepilin-type N-terminal cleavage/methylation domain-containing protein
MRHVLIIRRDKGKEGFTLMEVVITLSVIAILTAIMVPIISNNIQSARFTRANSDVTTLGKAMLEFRKDTTRWPVYEAGGASNQLLFSDQDATNDGIPDNRALPTGTGWGIGAGQCLSLAYNLISNSSGYDQGPSPDGLPAWNGPYLSEVRVDPWGAPYVVNSHWLFTDTDPGTPGFQFNSAYVFSAGPGSVLETAFGGAPPADSNDITFRLQ